MRPSCVKGFSLIELVLASSIGLITMGAISGILIESFFQIKKTEFSSSITDTRLEIMRQYRSSTGWQKIIDDNLTVLGCLREYNSCKGTEEGYIVINRVGNDLNLVDLPGGVNGYALNGLPCNTFSLAGDPTCIVQINMVAKINCPAGGVPCSIPTVQLDSKLVPGATANTRQLNLTRFEIHDKKVVITSMVPTEFVCATGHYNVATGAKSSEPGNTGLPPAPGNILPEIMSIRNPTVGDPRWGITCTNGYMATGCTVTNSGAVNANGAALSGDTEFADNSCLVGVREQNHSDTMSVVCCGVR